MMGRCGIGLSRAPHKQRTTGKKTLNLISIQGHDEQTSTERTDSNQYRTTNRVVVQVPPPHSVVYVGCIRCSVGVGEHRSGSGDFFAFREIRG